MSKSLEDLLSKVKKVKVNRESWESPVSDVGVNTRRDSEHEIQRDYQSPVDMEIDRSLVGAVGSRPIDVNPNLLEFSPISFPDLDPSLSYGGTTPHRPRFVTRGIQTPERIEDEGLRRFQSQRYQDLNRGFFLCSPFYLTKFVRPSDYLSFPLYQLEAQEDCLQVLGES